jgi:ketosteroid isomerase-like protein
VPDPLPFARQWVDDWNARDVEAVLRCYADDVVFTSPNALRVVPGSGGRVHGKDELRAYWTRALAGNPDLRFTLVGVSSGIDTLVLSYRDQTGRRVDEVLTVRDGLVAVGHATRRHEQ